MDKTTPSFSTRMIVYAGMAAAAYIVLTVVLAPLSFGPLQFRVSNFVKPLALFSPAFGWAFMVGTAIANLASPFGAWDFGVMPLVELASCLLAWRLRRWPIVALVIQSAIIAAGVAYFPLGMVLRVPFWETAGAVFVPQVVILVVSYYTIWRKSRVFLLTKG